MVYNITEHISVYPENELSMILIAYIWKCDVYMLQYVFNFQMGMLTFYKSCKPYLFRR